MGGGGEGGEGGGEREEGGWGGCPLTFSCVIPRSLLLILCT